MYLFNKGIFPDELKLGCITPIYKNGDREKVNNYRPICSLSPLSKTIEKDKQQNCTLGALLDKWWGINQTRIGGITVYVRHSYYMDTFMAYGIIGFRYIYGTNIYLHHSLLTPHTWGTLYTITYSNIRVEGGLPTRP